MPNIDTLKGGIKINIYPNDHVPPHIHAIYGEHEALINICNQEILKGFLPKAHQYTVQTYVSENEEDLLEVFFQLNPKIIRK